MKRGASLGLMVLLGLSLSCAGIQKPERSRFILLSSTIGPIDSGIVDVLENTFEKETGIRVRHVGPGRERLWISLKKEMWISFWSTRNLSKKNL